MFQQAAATPGAAPTAAAPTPGATTRRPGAASAATATPSAERLAEGRRRPGERRALPARSVPAAAAHAGAVDPSAAAPSGAGAIRATGRRRPTRQRARRHARRRRHRAGLRHPDLRARPTSAAATSAPHLPQDWMVACDKDRRDQVPPEAGEPEGHRGQRAPAPPSRRRQRHGTGQWIVNVDFTTGPEPGQPDRRSPRASTEQHAPAMQVADRARRRRAVRADDQRAHLGLRADQRHLHQKSAPRPGERPQVRRAAADLQQVAGRAISATLGKASLKAGLLAGAIGLGLVIIYSFIYYRALGIITIASLAVTGWLDLRAGRRCSAMIIGFTLTLAGIAGLHRGRRYHGRLVRRVLRTR